MFEEKSERRDFIKKAAYAVPMILTLKALPAFAAAGSKDPSGGAESKRKAGRSIQTQRCCIACRRPDWVCSSRAF